MSIICGFGNYYDLFTCNIIIIFILVMINKIYSENNNDNNIIWQYIDITNYILCNCTYTYMYILHGKFLFHIDLATFRIFNSILKYNAKVFRRFVWFIKIKFLRIYSVRLELYEDIWFWTIRSCNHFSLYSLISFLVYMVNRKVYGFS